MGFKSQPLWPRPLGGLERVRFLGLGFPEYGLKEGLRQCCWPGTRWFQLCHGWPLARVVLCSARKCLSVVAHLQGSSVTFGLRDSDPVWLRGSAGTGLHLRVFTLPGQVGVKVYSFLSFRIHAPHPQVPPHLEQDCCRFRGGKAVLWGEIKIQHHYHRLGLQMGLLLFSFVS